MGTQYSSDIQIKRTTEGIPSLFCFLSKNYQIHKPTMKVFLIAALCIAAVSADPWGYFGYGYGHPEVHEGSPLPQGHEVCGGCQVRRVPQELGQVRAQVHLQPRHGRPQGLVLNGGAEISSKLFRV